MANIMTMALRYKREYLKACAEDFEHFILEQDQLWSGTPVRYTREAYQLQYEWVKDVRHAAVKERLMKRARADMEWGWEFQYEHVQAKHRVAERLGLETEATQTFFITLRPDCSKVSFRDFFEKVKALLARKSFHTYTLSFEQKGLDESELGKGFHVHIVAKTSYRSVPEVLRAINGTYDEEKQAFANGTLSKWIAQKKIAPNCVDVKVCKNPKEHTQRYLVNYESNDGHKIATKETDAQWRINLGLQPLYTSEAGLGHLPIKSNRQVVIEAL